MNPLKRLASETAIYGVSSVFGRFLNYLLVPLFTYTFAPAEYGVVAEFYAYMGFLAVLLVFGLETGYFRFREGGTRLPETVYATALRFVLLALVLVTLFGLLFAPLVGGVAAGLRGLWALRSPEAAARYEGPLRRMFDTLLERARNSDGLWHARLKPSTGEVIEPDDGILAVGSGGSYALAAARALTAHSDLPARAIVREALGVAADICVYTNANITVLELGG